MQSTIKTEPKKLDYPCLMKSNTTGNIYLMKGDKVGIVLHSGNSAAKPIGTLCDFLQMEHLYLHSGTVTLSN